MFKNSSTSSLAAGYSHLLFTQQPEDSDRTVRTDSIKLKDPNMAVFYAIVPGILVHGTGYFYAGKTKTGLLLLETEVAGGVFMFMALASAFRAPGQHQLEADLMAWTGAILFGGSWVYDVIGSSIAVKMENRKLFGRKSANLEFEFDHKYNSVKIVSIRKF